MHVAFDMREESSDRAVTQAVTSVNVFRQCAEFGNRLSLDCADGHLNLADGATHECHASLGLGLARRASAVPSARSRLTQRWDACVATFEPDLARGALRRAVTHCYAGTQKERSM